MADLYVKLDVTYLDDEKIIAAGEKAELLYVRSLCLAKRLLSDGFIADGQLPRFHLTAWQARAKALVREGLWRRDEERGGYWIVAWSKHNRSAADVRAQQAAASEAALRGNHKRWHTKGPIDGCIYCAEGPPELPLDPPPDSSSRSGGRSGTRSGGRSPLRQRPESPETESKTETETTSSSGSSTSPPHAALTVVEEDDRLRQCWDLLARLKLRHQRNQGRGPTSETGWLTRVAATDREERYEEAVATLAKWPDLTAQHLAEVLNGQTEILKYQRRASGE